MYNVGTILFVRYQKLQQESENPDSVCNARRTDTLFFRPCVSHVECEIDKNCPFLLFLQSIENEEYRNLVHFEKTDMIHILELIDHHLCSYSHFPDFEYVLRVLIIKNYICSVLLFQVESLFQEFPIMDS